MKKIGLLLIISILLHVNSGIAQQLTPASADYDHKVEITPIVGYLLNGNIDFYQGELTFDNNINYGIAASVSTGYGTAIEFAYTFSPSTARFRSFSPDYINTSVATHINYIQLNGVKEFLDGQVRPFGFIGAGVSGFVAQEGLYDDWWSFAMNFGLGVKINITESIGIRLQGRMLLPLNYGGIGFYCGTGGCGGGATAYSTMIQGDFMGALVIGIK